MVSPSDQHAFLCRVARIQEIDLNRKYWMSLEGAANLHGGYQVRELSVNLLYQRVNILEIEVVFLYLAS